jgi:hypothetical protein
MTPSLLGCPKNPGVVLSSEEAGEPRESVDCSFDVFTLGDWRDALDFVNNP